MKRWQTSESITVGLFLALSGGFMDAYSYINRGKVFANAETGNIILMTLKICEGKFLESVNYLIPITSFAIGVAISEIIKRSSGIFTAGYEQNSQFHNIFGIGSAVFHIP